MTGTRLAMPGSGAPKLGLLFLTRGDVHHPAIWREFVDECRDRVRVFSHPKFLEALQGGFLASTAIHDRFETGWGTISLVKASLALFLSPGPSSSCAQAAVLFRFSIRAYRERVPFFGRVSGQSRANFC